MLNISFINNILFSFIHSVEPIILVDNSMSDYTTNDYYTVKEKCSAWDMGSFLRVTPCRLSLFTFSVHTSSSSCRTIYYIYLDPVIRMIGRGLNTVFACNTSNSCVICVMSMWLLNAWTLIYQLQYNITEGCLDESMWVCMEKCD